MDQSLRLLCIWCCSLWWMHWPMMAQNYFKQQAGSDKYFNQRITRFPNGDLLIGDSSVEAQRTGNGGKIYMTRMDPCGNELWSQAYERREEYLEFKDFQINEAGEIFVYGSSYVGLDEQIFLLKLNGRGKVIDFRIFQPETVDHFTYSIDLKNGQLMAYGLLLDFSTKKYGFVAVFDQGLNFDWGVKFTPFESFGDAVITKDGGFLCRSGNHLFKLDPKGALEWAHTLAPNTQNTPVSGPLEVDDGYILESYGEGFGFFYKIDLSGGLVWKSLQFPAKAFPVDMSLLPDGNILGVYSAEVGGEQQVCHVVLSPAGQILRRQKLSTTHALRPGRIYQSQGQNQTLTLSGNFDPFVAQPAAAGGFLAQTSWPGGEAACLGWEDQPITRPNQVSMDFSPLDTAILASSFELFSTPLINAVEFSSPLSDACDEDAGPEVIRSDTLLACGAGWTVSLPSTDFVWTDGTTDNPRLLEQAGIYQASNQDCGSLQIYEYRLEKPECECKVYLPTAFSPNADGINDRLEFFSDCTLNRLEITIFNRWGDRVFESTAPGNAWNGAFQRKPAPNGVYLVVARYEWQTPEGAVKKGELYQEVTLLK